MHLNHKRLQAEFDAQSGTLCRLVFDGTTLIQSDSGIPFVLETAQNIFTSQFERFDFEQTDDALALRWYLANSIEIHARVTLLDDTLSFQADVRNAGDTSVHSLEYPVLGGITTFGIGIHQVAHAFATGLLIDDPLHNFYADGDGFRHMPYPESFSGASMQFFGYYKLNGVGLLFAAKDGACHQKWLNFYKSGTALCASQMAGYEDIGPGKGVNAVWPFEVSVLENCTWETMAEQYRSWAIAQSWCDKGTWAERSEDNRATWLLQDTAAVTFGINACHDRTKWIKQYRQDIGGSLFHILGPDWAKVEQNFYNSVPGGLSDWLPTRFNQANIDTIRAQSDHFAPFEFDFLVDPDKSDGDNLRQNLQVWPSAPKSIDKYTFNMLCPITAYTQALHTARDRAMAAECGCDGVYYDISANNIIKTCMAENHGHPVGAGRGLTLAYQQIYDDTKQAISREIGTYSVMGTEMVNETLIAQLDYYQARANAHPNSALETWPFRKLIRQGKARLVPLFKYVYSEYAPVRCDGWGKLTQETGDIIYHTIAKTVLWGGLFEINSEYSEMERLDGASNAPDEHYYRFKPEGFDYAPGIAAFIGTCAALRTGLYGKPLIYGRMVQTPPVQCRKLHRTYYQYNHGMAADEQGDRGIILLDAVLAQAYAHGGDAALYVVNTSLHTEVAVIALPSGWEALQGFSHADGAWHAVETEPTQGGLRIKLQPLETIVFTNQRR